MAEHRKRSRIRLTLTSSWLVIGLVACAEDTRPARDAMLDPSTRSDGGMPHNEDQEPAAVLDATPSARLDAGGTGLDASPASSDASRAPNDVDGARANNVAVDGSVSQSAGNHDDAGDPHPTPVVTAACSSSALYQAPEDPSTRGPWPVGVKTARLPLPGVAVPMTVELWYPAKRGSEAGKLSERYDLTALLPSGQASKLQPEDSLPQRCDCFRDLPIDSEHGPYPAVIYVHGTGSFRTASLSLLTHWASRGFIVIAADHLGLFVQDFLAASSLGECQGSGVATDLARDLDAEFAALGSGDGPLAFLGSALDRSRIGLSGHGPGAQAVGLASGKPNVLVELALAPTSAVSASAALKSTLMVAGHDDTVSRWATAHLAYAASPAPKRLVGIRAAQHFDLTDLCSMKSPRGESPTQVAGKRGVCGMWLLDAVARCGDSAEPAKTQRIVRHVTTAALEETLHCRDRKRVFSELQALYPEISTLEMSPP